MLNDRFLSRLHEAFPSFYDRVSAEALEEASRLKAETGGDVQKALTRARFRQAGHVWWPYVKGSIPFVGNDRPAMEAFARLVLVVDHVVGHPPPTMEAARSQVTEVLRHSLDVERLRGLLEKERRSESAAAAGAGLLASFGAVWAPIQRLRRFRKAARYVPVPVRVALGAVVLATLASIPLLAAFSAGHQAEKSALSERTTELPYRRAVP